MLTSLLQDLSVVANNAACNLIYLVENNLFFLVIILSGLVQIYLQLKHEAESSVPENQNIL